MRRTRLALIALLAGVLVGGVAPIARPEAPAAAATTYAYSFGQTPLADALNWAGQRVACGLTTNQLAAMMLAPTYPETGASGSLSPSPMTLSRYDTGAGLYAFGDKATSTPKAFWHPGVGAWAFDSAGGWNLTAADAINTDSAAKQAATTVASRWCASSGTDAERRKAVWSIWFGCTAQDRCETIYNAIYDPTTLKVNVDPSVGRLGGGEPRTCRIAEGTVPCLFVDPAKAQGYKAWAVPAFGPSPVSAPFYVITVVGTEQRWWLRQDSGYGSTIEASKPITANARTSLTWKNATAMCDVTTGRGVCAPAGPALYLRNTNTSGVADRSLELAAPPGGRVLMCDWDGDGVDTAAEVLNGTWLLTNSPSAGAVQRTFGYGNPSGDVPVCGDWNGDGVDTAGVRRGNVWYLSNAAAPSVADLSFGYGDAGDVPIVGDWNGDGVDTAGVHRGNIWYLANATRPVFADRAFAYGDPSDTPVVGDWNHDGTDTPGLTRNGRWYLTNTAGSPAADLTFGYGDPGDKAVAGSWSAGAPSTIGIVR